MTSPVVLSTDLLDRSRFPAGTAFARTADALVAAALTAGTVAVDLARPDALDAISGVRAAAPPARIVAYGSHVDRERLAAALDAGADEAMPRSRFFADVPAALAG